MENIARTKSHAEASTSGTTAPSAEEWRYAEAKARLEELERSRSRHAAPPVEILRSSQVDAARLDTELTLMLGEQFAAVFKFFQAGRVARFEPELNALLRLLIFHLSVWKGRATPGSELMNLRYRNERAVSSSAAGWGGKSGVEGPGLSHGQRVVFGLGFVALPYLWGRLQRFAIQREWGESEDDVWGWRAWKLMRWMESAYKVAALANLLVFLRQGRYRNLLERLLGARLVYSVPSMQRAISFEYLNRQLVWRELSEFLLFLLPLININKVRRAIASCLPRMQPLTDGSAASSTTAKASGAWQQQGEVAHQALEQLKPCPICNSREVVTPFEALPCGHVFCYYCLRAHCEADKQFQCPVDGIKVVAMRRWCIRL